MRSGAAHVLRPDDEIIIGIERRVLAFLQHLERRGTRGVELALRRLGPRTGARESRDQERIFGLNIKSLIVSSFYDTRVTAGSASFLPDFRIGRH